MRQGLKNRIKFDPSNPPRMNKIKTDYLSKNSFNARVKDTYCVSNGACSNNKDANGRWTGVSQKQQQTQRKYYAPFRQPLKGYRKTLNSQGVIPGEGNSNCWSTTEIYKDTYALLDPKSTNCLDNGSISTSTIPLTDGGNKFATKSKSGNYTRTNKPLIRSGMQPNVAGKQNSGLSGIKTATRYSYSYRELINNRRKDTQIKKLSTQKPSSSTYMSNPKKMPGYGGDCTGVDNCNPSETIYRYNNKKFATQGAVESSDRITRLKLDTIKGSTKCEPGVTTTYGESCNGVYSTGNLQTSRTKDWPKYTTKNNAQVKYTALFNADHTEPQYTQVNALARTRGSSGNKRYNTGKIIENGGSTCPTNCPQFLM
tara:strand:- start:221 stop:1327 length:1107 start_codon:yes stop_codon:yes gene_type:complete